MKLKIDRTLSILGINFDVSEESIKDCGDSDAAERWIRIDPNNHNDHKVELFYHEWAHMVFALTGHSELLTEEMEEALCQVLGIALADLISHNKNLPKYDAP